MDTLSDRCDVLKVVVVIQVPAGLRAFVFALQIDSDHSRVV